MMAKLDTLLASNIGNTAGGEEAVKGKGGDFSAGRRKKKGKHNAAEKYYPALTASPGDKILSGRRQPALFTITSPPDNLKAPQ